MNLLKPFRSSVIALHIMILYLHLAHSADLCPMGNFLYTPREGPDVCLNCNPGTFMPDWLHKRRQCFSCTEIQNRHLEIFVAPCNESHDTEIHCIDGYYWEKSSRPDVRGQCQKCTKCPFPKRPCQKFSDTVCCPAHHYDVYVNKHGKPQCVRLCGQGQFLDPERDQCLPCPQNTYMHIAQHTHICQVPQFSAEEILRSCNRTHPAVIGCRKGYYRRSTKLHGVFPFHTCVKCTECSEDESGFIHEGRACHKFHDTVCCPRPSMDVVESPGGPECRQKPTDATKSTFYTTQKIQCLYYQRPCGENEYLKIDINTSSAICLRCLSGTYMDETYHFNTICNRCDNAQCSKRSTDTSQTVTGEHGQPLKTAIVRLDWNIMLLSLLLLLLLLFVQE